MIDPVILEDASILTIIGIGTAFGLLLLLMVVVAVVRLFSSVILEGAARRARSKADRTEAESRNRAQAAVAAVTAIMATRTDSGVTMGSRG